MGASPELFSAQQVSGDGEQLRRHNVFERCVYAALFEKRSNLFNARRHGIPGQRIQGGLAPIGIQRRLAPVVFRRNPCEGSPNAVAPASHSTSAGRLRKGSIAAPDRPR